MKSEEVIKSTITLEDSKKVILNIMYTNCVIGESFAETLKPYDLSSEQYNVLRILRGQKGKPANMSVIQERMITKNSNTTRLIDKLLLKGYVTREVCPENRRKIDVKITDEGLTVLHEIDPLLVSHEYKFASNLSNEELIQLNHLLEKFRQHKNESNTNQ
jgi:DNA-binding MarR family transcriptional regulator